MLCVKFKKCARSGPLYMQSGITNAMQAQSMPRIDKRISISKMMNAARSRIDKRISISLYLLTPASGPRSGQRSATPQAPALCPAASGQRPGQIRPRSRPDPAPARRPRFCEICKQTATNRINFLDITFIIRRYWDQTATNRNKPQGLQGRIPREGTPGRGPRDPQPRTPR
jgi:hypothetical protein